MKKFLSLLISTIIVLSAFAVYADDEISVYLNGNRINFDAAPRIIDGRTMVPMRAIFEALGATVEWNDKERTVLSVIPGVAIVLYIDDNKLLRNTIEQTVDVAPRIIDGRTFVPLRVISEYMGTDVEWIDTTKSVYITSNNKIQRSYWNDNFYYVGETTGGTSDRYGALYDVNNNELFALGKFDSKYILEGTTYYSNGDIFKGVFGNGQWQNGTYHYASGDSYIGEFLDSKKHGEGTYFYKDGSFIRGKWANDLPNGSCIFYDAVEDVRFQGNYVEGKRDGDFLINDFYENKTYYVTYKDGNLYDSKKEAEDNYNRKLDECRVKLAELDDEYKELEDWRKDELEKLYDYVLNGDPHDTDWAKSIYKQYNVNKYSGGTASNGGNIDSFAAANAMRQQAALEANAEKAILAYNETYIENWKALIQEAYDAKKRQLDEMYKSIQNEIKIANQVYLNAINQ